LIPLRDDNPTRRFAYVTAALIVVNVLVYFFWQPHDGGRQEVNFLYQHAAVPCEVTSGAPVDTNARCETQSPPAFPGKNVYVALFISMFLHANLIHIGGNMLFLWIFGNNVEDVMGPVIYIFYYIVGGVVASLAHVLLYGSSNQPVIGASGAIAAVMGVYLVRFPRARVLTIVPIFIFFTTYLPAWLVLGVWFIGQFGISAASSGVATAAHIGGFVFGVLVGLLFLRPPRRPSLARAGWSQ
jgi:membrane associated rhomboid family serine protease